MKKVTFIKKANSCYLLSESLIITIIWKSALYIYTQFIVISLKSETFLWGINFTIFDIWLLKNDHLWFKEFFALSLLDLSILLGIYFIYEEQQSRMRLRHRLFSRLFLFFFYNHIFRYIIFWRKKIFIYMLQGYNNYIVIILIIT